MRLLVVLTDLTVPPREGLHQQSLLLMQELKRRGVQLEIFVFAKDPALIDLDVLKVDFGLALAAKPALLRGPSVYSGLAMLLLPAHRQHPLARFLLTKLAAANEYDAIYLEGAAAAGLLRRRWAGATVVNVIDPPSRRWTRMAKVAGGVREYLACIARALVAYALERLLNKQLSTWVTVSMGDADYLSRVHGHRRTVAIPVMIPESTRSAAAVNSSTAVKCLIFADLRHEHMRDSFRWFVDTVIRVAGIPSSLMSIDVLARVGPDDLEMSAVIGDLGIRLIPWVDDYAATIIESDIVVLPDRVGTGLKNRAIQAMALGRAVLATEVALEGIPATSGVHAVFGNSSDYLAEQLRTLVDDRALREAISANGKRMVQSTYASSVVGDQWMSLFRSLERREKAGG